MSLQNRVTPYSDLVAVPDRGALMGNRGVLHDDHRQIVRFSRGRRWIACLTEFKGRRRSPMTPGHYTGAVLPRRGHRPVRGTPPLPRVPPSRRAALPRGVGPRDRRRPGTALEALDRSLHEDRLEAPGRMRRWSSAADELPDGAMVEMGGEAYLIWEGAVRGWTPGGYTLARRAPAGRLRVLTPRAICAAIAAGYRPAVAL